MTAILAVPWVAEALLLAVALGAVSSGPSRAHLYRVVPERSELVVRLYKAGIASILAHDHVVRATAFSGQVRFDSDEPRNSSVELEVDARSLVADEPEVRREHGIQDEISASDRRQVQANMEARGQLDVQRYPTIRFASVEVEPLSGGRLRIGGELTLHGATRRVVFPAAVILEEGVLRAEASLRFRQSDFGIEPYSGALGMVRNRDEVMLHVELVAVPTEDEPA